MGLLSGKGFRSLNQNNGQATPSNCNISRELPPAGEILHQCICTRATNSCKKPRLPTFMKIQDLVARL
jgi:hypothetical protein